MAGTTADWDPGQYLQYADERSRPFYDLIARIQVTAPSYVVDLGCGPGNLTRVLADRWPAATVVGVDSSKEMIAAADSSGSLDRLTYVCADLRSWLPESRPDVVTANAVLHWVPGHLDLVGEIAGWLASGGVLAFQVPDNFDAPSHVVIRDLRLSSRWRDRLGEGADRSAGVERPEAYFDALAAAGLEPDVWQTTYLHRLTGDDPVLEWVKGTALRPVLTALEGDDEAAAEFLAECGAALRSAYPARPDGPVLLPFRRTFAVGRTRAAA